MATVNKVMLIGRLTRDPETKTTASSKVVKLGFAVSERKKNAQTGQYEDAPVFLDLEAWNRPNDGFKLADFINDKCRKGSQIYVEGKLMLDQWEDKNGGGKRSKVKILVTEVQLLDARPQEGQQQGRTANEGVDHQEERAASGGSSGEIPF